MDKNVFARVAFRILGESRFQPLLDDYNLSDARTIAKKGQGRFEVFKPLPAAMRNDNAYAVSVCGLGRYRYRMLCVCRLHRLGYCQAL